VIEPSGDIVADLPLFQAFYADKRGKYPHEESDIALRPADLSGRA